MFVDINKRFDLFIAYHGDNKTGSAETAHEIYNYFSDKGIDVFFHQVTNRSGAYKDNPTVASNSKLFLFVVNKNVPVDSNGKLANRDSSGHIKRIWQEVSAFQEGESCRRNESMVSRLFLCPDIPKNDYDKYTSLHVIFNGRDCLHENDFSDIEQWVNDSLNVINHNKTQSMDKLDYDQTKTIWNSDMASTWHKIVPPSRPSKSEIEIYRKYLKLARDNSKHAICKALILGSTIEFRELTCSEGFHTTIVDISEEYYNEISKELLKSPDNENVVFCNWLNMDQNLIVGSYDVVLGDLSIGNIEPKRIKDFINQVAKMLAEGGFFLGKTIFHFNSKSYTKSDIYQIFKEYFKLKKKEKEEQEQIQKKPDNSDIDIERIETISPYGYSMYPLSIFAMDKNNKIDFINLFNLVCEIKKSKAEKMNDPIFAIYTDDETSFKEKMKLDFYIYEISEFLELCYNYFILYDIEYGNDIYSKDFPLLILSKRKHSEKKPLNISIDQSIQDIADFITSNGDLVQDWSRHISSQYFLLCIIHMLNSKGYSPNLISKIYNHVLIAIRECLDFSIDDNLNSIIKGIYDDKIDFETLAKYPNIQAKVTNTSRIIKQQKASENRLINNYTNIPLKNNYTLGLLAYNTWFVAGEKESDTFIMVIKKLFSNVEIGSLWDPKSSIWLSARIAIALFPMYNALSDQNRLIMVEIIKKIAFLYNREDHIWKKAHMGNTSNTLSLCIQVLIKYRNLLSHEKNLVSSINQIFHDLLSYYIINSNVYDTIVRFYIGGSKTKLATGDLDLYQKTNNNVSVISAFIRLIDYCIANSIIDKEYYGQLKVAKEELTRLLLNFWDNFNPNARTIHKIVQKNEYSLVPQIIYSCLFPFDNE